MLRQRCGGRYPGWKATGAMPQTMPYLQERAYDSDPAVPTHSHDSSAASALTMNTLSRDVERTAFAEVKGDVCPEAPIFAENSIFYPRGPPSATKIRRLQQASGDARFPHPQPEIHSIPIHPVPAHFNPILSATVPASPSARFPKCTAPE